MSEQIVNPQRTPEEWGEEAIRREGVDPLDLMTSASEWPAVAYEQAGNLKKAAEFYLLYGATSSKAHEILQGLTEDERKEVRANAAKRLEENADRLEPRTFIKPTHPLLEALTQGWDKGKDEEGLEPYDYVKIVNRYREYAARLRSESNN